MANVSASARNHRVVRLPGIYSDTDSVNLLNPSLRDNRALFAAENAD